MGATIHVHVILLACIVWLLSLFAAALSTPLGLLFNLSAIAQVVVFGYGILIYEAWASGRSCRWFHVPLWWLPQVIIVTVFAYDPVAKAMGAPLGGFCAAMPLQLTATTGWHGDHTSLAIGINILAIVAGLWSLSSPHRLATTGSSVSPRSGFGLGRTIATIAIVIPTLILVAAAVSHALGVTTWIKKAPPEGLERIILSSGRVVPVSSVAPVRFEDGGSLLLLESFTDLPPTRHGPELTAEAQEVWECYRPFVERSGYGAAAIAVSVRPAPGFYVAPHIKKFGWSRADDGSWHEVASDQPK